MGFDIESFRQAIFFRNGVQKNNLFEVSITVPNSLLALYSTIDAQSLTFLCLEGAIPGPAIDAIPINRYGYGLLEKMPFNTVFNDLTYAFICDNSGFITNFFRAWQRAIQEHSSEGNINTPPNQGPNPAIPSTNPYFVNYKSAAVGTPSAIGTGYATTVNITTFDSGGKATDQVTLHQAFPINVADQPHGWDACDQFKILPVTISYMDVSYNASTYASLLAKPQQEAGNQTPNNSILASIGNIISGTASKLSSII